MAILESRERLVESLDRAQQYHADCQFEQAVEVYTHLLARLSGQVPILVQRGMALQEAGDLDGAMLGFGPCRAGAHSSRQGRCPECPQRLNERG
jgi:hypothetical protein